MGFSMGQTPDCITPKLSIELAPRVPGLVIFEFHVCTVELLPSECFINTEHLNTCKSFIAFGKVNQAC